MPMMTAYHVSLVIVIALIHIPAVIYGQSEVPIGSIQVSPGFYHGSAVIIKGYVQEITYANVHDPYNDTGSHDMIGGSPDNMIHAQIVTVTDYTGVIDVQVLHGTLGLKPGHYVQVHGQVSNDRGKAVIVTRNEIWEMMPP